mgnify:FL=1
MAIQRPDKSANNNQNAIDKWVENRDNKVVVSKSENVSEEPIKRFTVLMPESMHQELKNYCAQHGISLKDFVIQAIQNEMQR